MTTDARVDVLDFSAVHQTDPLAAPQLAELAIEYTTRYGGDTTQRHTELLEYPAQEFEPPGGALIVAMWDGLPSQAGRSVAATR